MLTDNLLYLLIVPVFRRIFFQSFKGAPPLEEMTTPAYVATKALCDVVCSLNWLMKFSNNMD